MSSTVVAARVVGFVGLIVLLVSFDVAAAGGRAGGAATFGVTYDGRSLIINGRRELIFSGAIHYPRSTPEMWPELIRKAKAGGLNAIETYVFWNIHEPRPGQFSFRGKYDLVRFIELVQKNGMYAIVRFGPFVQAEWNHGGLPYWLREIPNMFFRTDNGPFKFYMKRFVETAAKLLKDSKLFASQGGPIILAQIENEYNNIAAAYKTDGKNYIRWSANMAVHLKVGVPWVMCKQNDAPGSVINACNGRNCGDTWRGPNSPNKPSLWTENWTAQYRVFGDPPSQRAAEDIAYSVARFFSKNGSLVNYYMYHGGTNFGRTGASFMMTRYYDEAPLDEFGLPKEPKYGHLRDLHQALQLCKKALLWGDYSLENLGNGLEARILEQKHPNVCVAFLTNTKPKVDATVMFRGVKYFLPRRSISILPDCKTVVYNTQRVNSQHNARTFNVARVTKNNNKWLMYSERIPKLNRASIKSKGPLELFNMTKDNTDYLWYSTSFTLDAYDLPFREDIRPVIQISNLGHAMHVFVNRKYIGSGHGTKAEKSFVFQSAIPLKVGINYISILGNTVGMQDSGAYLEHRKAGLQTVTIQGLNTGTLDLSHNVWQHNVGLKGEKLGIFTEERAKAVQWKEAKNNMQATWYKRYFNAPNGNDPVALDLTSMGKGLAWVNGECIGRYWVSYLNPLGQPSQSVYHVPRSFIKPKDNVLVLFEEHTGKPEGVQVMTVKRDNICTFISESHPGNVDSWWREHSNLKSNMKEFKPHATLKCTGKKVISKVYFASFGNPSGLCGDFILGACHAPLAKSVAEKACLGKKACVLPVSHKAYGADMKCPGTTGTLAVQVKCSRKGN